MRRFGAAALDLAYVAAGRIDGFWEVGLSPWDIAAGLILIREAGGFTSTIKGGTDILSDGTVVAGNELIQKQLLEVTNRPVPTADSWVSLPLKGSDDASASMDGRRLGAGISDKRSVNHRTGGITC